MCEKEAMKHLEPQQGLSFSSILPMGYGDQVTASDRTNTILVKDFGVSDMSLFEVDSQNESLHI